MRRGRVHRALRRLPRPEARAAEERLRERLRHAPAPEAGTTGERVRRALRHAPVPDAAVAEECARALVLAAFADADAGTRRQPHRARRPLATLAAAAAAVAAVAALALTPPGEAVADWLADIVRPGAEDAAPVLRSLPAAGRLLVDSPGGQWVVGEDGGRRRLGSYDSASWSPRGLFVAVTRGRELLAVEQAGEVRWSIAGAARITGARWSPDGYRVAYLSGRSLRVVAGDGTGDRSLARRVAPVAPAWRQRTPQQLSFVDAAGHVRLVHPESGRLLWRTGAALDPRQLAWTARGRRLLALGPAGLTVLDARGRIMATHPAPAGTRDRAAAWAPAGDRAALVRHHAGANRAELVVVVPGGRERVLFAGQGRFTSLAWSPDGRWLAIGWRDADQWVFVRAPGRGTAAPARVEAVAGVARQFDPADPAAAGFADVGEWCCAR